MFGFEALCPRCDRTAAKHRTHWDEPQTLRSLIISLVFSKTYRTYRSFLFHSFSLLFMDRSHPEFFVRSTDHAWSNFWAHRLPHGHATHTDHPVGVVVLLEKQLADENSPSDPSDRVDAVVRKRVCFRPNPPEEQVCFYRKRW